MDLSHKTDRELQEEIWHATAGRALKPGDGVGVDDLITKDESAPDPVQPVVGFDKVFGPRPHPSQASAGSVWRAEAAKVTKVYGDIPDEYEKSAIKFAAATGIVPIFLKYGGELKVCLRPGLPPTLWLVEAERFLSDDGSDVDALIEIANKAKK